MKTLLFPLFTLLVLTSAVPSPAVAVDVNGYRWSDTDRCASNNYEDFRRCSCYHLNRCLPVKTEDTP